jgi:CBS domain-containing protein
MIAASCRARDVMSPDPIVVGDDLTAAEVVERLREYEISGAPVKDASGRLVGVISLADLARSASEDADLARDRSSPDFYLRGWEERFNPEDLEQLHVEGEGRRVRDLMTPALYTVDEDASVAEVASLMVTTHLHRVLVTRGEAVVGIISTLDLLKLLVESEG